VITMGLDDFNTDGPRTYTDNSSTTRHDADFVHMPKALDTDGLELPNGVIVHGVEYYTYIPADENIEGSAICICTECNKTASTYEAIVKTDHLQYKDKEWVEDYRGAAMDNKLEKPDTRPEAIKNGSGNNTSSTGGGSSSSGLDSFST